MYSIPYSACSVIRKKNSPSLYLQSTRTKRKKRKAVCVVCWDFFLFFFSLYSQFLHLSKRSGINRIPYMCSYLSTYIYTRDYSKSYIRRSHTIEHMNRESKEEEQVGELFQLEFEDLCAFLKKMMSSDLEVYLCVIIGFWEKFCCVFEEL